MAAGAHLICALAAEGRSARRTGLPITICGMGLWNAFHAAEYAVAQQPRLVVSWGVAGALSADLRLGEIVVPEQVTDGQGTCWQSALGDARGRVVTVDRPVTTPEEKARLHQRTGADIADMESAAIAAVCTAAGVPFVVIRAISDDCAQALPEWLIDLVDVSGADRLLRTLHSGLRGPRSLATLVRCIAGYHRALRSLRSFAATPPSWLQALQ